MEITVRIADAAQGQVARGVRLRLESVSGIGFDVQGQTDESGVFRYYSQRDEDFEGLAYRLTVGADEYFASLGLASFNRGCIIEFRFLNASDEQEIMVIMSPYSLAVCAVSGF